jgi:hypothetical protein
VVEKKQKHRERNDKQQKANHKNRIKCENSREANRRHVTEKIVIRKRIIRKYKENEDKGS